MPKSKVDLRPSASRYGLMTLFTLYLAQGLPVGFMTQALPALLRHYGVSLTQIGVSGLLMLPWAIKFLWAPWIDRLHGWQGGQYRSWIVLMQILTLLILLILAFLPETQLKQLSGLWSLFVLLLAMNLFCATQDIATDALAVNILGQRQLHWGNTFQVMGSRLGYIFGGGLVLYAIDVLSWKVTFIGLVAAVLINSFPVLFYQEPKFHFFDCNSHVNRDWKQHVKYLYGHLYSTPELKLWLLVLLSFKLAEGIAGPILKPMMIDMGLSLGQIGLYVSIVGALCALGGAWLAGGLMKFFSLQKMLFIFSILQTISILYYVMLAYWFHHQQPFALWHIYIANALEECCSAMSLVAMLSLIMRYSRTHLAGTDFTLQVALMSMVSGTLYVFGGRLADLWGYYWVLILVFILSCLSLLPKFYWWRYLHR